VRPQPRSFWQASGLFQVIAGHGRIESWCSLVVVAQVSTVVASKSEKVSCLILCLLSLEYNDVALKEYKASDPLVLRSFFESYLRLMFMLSFNMRYILISKFHFVSTFNDLFDSESSWSNHAPYSGWNDLLNNLSEKHFTRLSSKQLLSCLITCLTQSKVTQMLLNNLGMSE